MLLCSSLPASSSFCTLRRATRAPRHPVVAQARPYAADRQERRLPDTADDFEAANIRLRGLLQDDGGPVQSVESSAPAIKKGAVIEKSSRSLLKFFTLTLLGAYACQLLGHPLSGSESLTWWERAAHFGCGAAVAAPLGLLKLLSWSEEMHSELPGLDRYHWLYRNSIKDTLTSLDSFQVALYYLADIVQHATVRIVVLQIFLSLPLVAYSHRLQELGWQLPEALPIATAVLITAIVGGLTQFLKYSPPAEQYLAVKHAVENSDNHYRTQLMTSSSSSQSRDARKMSNAFKDTASAWLMESLVSALATASVASLEVLLISGLWQGTHDISAALPAAVLLYGADVVGAYKDVKQESSY